MPNDRVACNVKERLNGLVSELGAGEVIAGMARDFVTFGRSNERGLKRVPLEGPPTCNKLH